MRFAMTSPPSGCQRDLHPQAVERARYTKKAPRMGAAPGIPVYKKGCLVYVPTPFGELGQKELLREICADAFGCTDREISKHQSRAAIRLGVIEV